MHVVLTKQEVSIKQLQAFEAHKSLIIAHVCTHALWGNLVYPWETRCIQVTTIMKEEFL